jgi:hypothetical protein
MAAASIAVLAAVSAGARPPEGDRGALPDRDAFLERVGAHLRTDASILRNYVYTRTVEERRRDASGRVVETRRRVFEVWPLPDDPEGFRVTIVHDNEPAPVEAVARQRAEYKSRLARIERERAGESPSARERRLGREAEDRRQNQAMLADVRNVFDVKLVRRETVKGVPCVLVTFTPRADAAPETREGRLLTSVGGRAWFSETDQELVRVEASAINTIRYGWGVLARINRGARAVIDRQRRDDGAWVPARYELSASGRLLLVKGINRDATVTFTDFRRAAGR